MMLAERLRAGLARPHDLASLRWGDLDPDDPLHETWRDAAVLVAITDRAEPGVILTLRTDQLRNHAGQVAFPGGRIEAEDADATAAALREAQEEIGLDPAAVTVVGTADRYRTASGFVIQPVIGVIDAATGFLPDPNEVAAVFEAPLGFLLDLANHRQGSGEWQGRTRFFTELTFGEYRIWGATAAILGNLSQRLAGL